MSKQLLILILLISVTTFSKAQKALIKGVVTDTSSGENLSNAVISLLRSEDSVLYKVTRSDDQGKFLIKGLYRGKYILLVTYPKHADYIEQLTLTDTSQIDLSKIILSVKAKLLEEVVVKQRISIIKIKGDTTEFTADSFRVRPSALVEDLLKKLPCLKIDKDGKITVQGEKVWKVLVDGEEFFGDDPTLVTQNLLADMVDKVQVFGKKSEQAAFIGVDDGEKTKTINIKLKDNKKNGYFGKAFAGVATDDYHNYGLMTNCFKSKLKISAYGIASSTGQTGLNWEDRSKYGESIGSNGDFNESNDYLILNVNSDELNSWKGQYNGLGYPSVKTCGLHFNNKWNDDENSLNGNYKIMQLNVRGTTTSNTENILPDTLFYNNQKETFSNQILRNRLDGSYEYQIDSSSSVKINANAGTDHKNTSSTYTSEALAMDSSKVNSGSRSITTVSDNKSLNGNLLWKKKFRKKGRTVFVSISENFEDVNSNGYVFADNRYYKGGIIEQEQITDQYKAYYTTKRFISFKASYSEPISRYASVVFNYGINQNNNFSNRSSFNKSADGKYTQLDTAYSKDYRFNIFIQMAGVNLNYIKKKIRLNFGNSFSFINFNQKDVKQDSGSSRNFTNFYPTANFTYSVSTQKSLSLTYNGNITQPSIGQIQPVKNNEDPLNVNLGNPALKPQFINNINIGFSQYNALKEANIYANIGYQFTYNALSNSNRVDSFSKHINQTINLNGNRSLYGYISYSFKWKKPAIYINFNSSYTQGRYINIVNEILNVTNSNNYTLSIDLSTSKEKKYELSFTNLATYTQSNSSIQADIKTNYWTFNIQPSFDVYLSQKLQIHSDADASFRQKIGAFDFNTNVIFWNAWVGKKFFQNESLLLKISGNDLLNQNIGFNRIVNSNFISQNTYATIGRYYMLSLIWNFTKASNVTARNYK